MTRSAPIQNPFRKLAFAFPNFERSLPFWIVTVPWLVLYIPRPFLLGYYGDDWWVLHTVMSFNTWERYSYFLHATYAQRPVLGAILYGGSFIFPKSAFFYHSLAALLSFLSAWLLYKLFKAIAAQANLSLTIEPALAAACWLAFPWNLGFTAWPIAATSLYSQLFFVGAFLTSLQSPHRLLRCFLLLLLSYFVYEPFYFQFVIFILILLLNYKERNLTVQTGLKLFTVLCLAQLLPLLWNRMTTRMNMGVVHPNIANLSEFGAAFYENLWIRIPRLLRALPETSNLFLLVLSSMIAMAFFALILLAVRRRFKSMILLIGFAACGILGFLISVAILSLTLKGPFPIGIVSRFNLNLSLWASLILFVLLAAIRFFSIKGIRFSFISGLCLLAVLSVSSWQRMQGWHKATLLQEEVLQDFPISRLESMSKSKDPMVVFICPFWLEGDIPVWAAFYDLGMALHKKLFLNQGRKLLSQNQIIAGFLPAFPYWDFRWEDDALILYRDGRIDYRFPTKEVWVYDYFNKTLVKASRGLSISDSKVLSLGDPSAPLTN